MQRQERQNQSTMAGKVSLKLLIDKEKNRVAFAECNKDFVDILFSFLVMPIGTVMRLAGKDSGLGCMDTLYKSVENLDVDYLLSDACKETLLSPRNPGTAHCNNGVVKINDLEYENYYCCSRNGGSVELYSKDHRFYSTVRNERCFCGRLMNVHVMSTPSSTDEVFIKGNNQYMITDDLHVISISTSRSLSLLKNMGIDDCSGLLEKKVEIGKEETLHLLKRALLSKTPLTDVFVTKSDKVYTSDINEKQIRKFLKESEMKKQMSMSIVFNKSCNQVLYAEASEEVVDFFFSFLTFPLGLVSKLYNEFSSVGCIDHIYSSVKDLADKDHIISKKHADMLLRPTLAPHHSFPHHILKIDEAATTYFSKQTIYQAKNPKITAFVTEKCGGFLKGHATFMITDDLDVKVASAISGISVLNKSEVPIDDVEVKTVNVGEEEALKLLKASLISTTPLSEVFGVKEGSKKWNYECQIEVVLGLLLDGLYGLLGKK